MRKKKNRSDTSREVIGTVQRAMAQTPCGRGARRRGWQRVVATTENSPTRKKTKNSFVFALFFLCFFSFSVFFALPASAKTVPTAVVGDAKKPTKRIGSHAKSSNLASKPAEFSRGASSGDGKHDKVTEDSTFLPIMDAHSHSMDKDGSVRIDELHVDADAFSRTRPNTRKSQKITSLGVPFEDVYLRGSGANFNSVGNPKKITTTHGGWTACNSMKSCDSVPGYPTYSVFKGVCIVEGAIKGADWGLLATLPEDCRPEKRITFGVNNHEESTRVDVFPNGEVKYIDGGKSNGWLSLTGIKFATNETKDVKMPLDFLHGATNYGEDYEDAFYIKIDDECVLGGSIRKGSSWEVAQLPEECRPEKALMFSANTYHCRYRLEIHKDGKIKGVTGECHDVIPLDGITFIPKDSKKDSVALAPSLESGWEPYGESSTWEAPSYTLVDGECVVQGLIRGGSSWSHVATLPVNCRPHRILVFTLQNDGFSSRVDVIPDGTVVYKAGKESGDWISLSGIRFTAIPEGAVFLGYGWQPYGEEWGIPTYTVQDNVCEVIGVIYGYNWDRLAILPEDCRPEKRMVFNANNNEYSTRVDVFPNGEVKYIAGGSDRMWLSLTGIKFVTKEAKDKKKELTFLNGATNYGEDYENAFYSKINGECVLGGLIRKGSSWEVAQLPEECRPEKALVANVNNHECNMRLDIYENGKIKAIVGGCHDWVVLSGVSFIPKDSKASSVALAPSLKRGWKTYDGGVYWEAPSYTLVGEECIVQGLVQGGYWDHIATLPVECRPYKTVISHVNNNEYSTRLDVSPDGKVKWIAGGKSNGYVSLTGMRFEVKPLPPPQISIGNAWSLLALEEFDFDIRVSHDLCGTSSSCFGNTVDVDANVALGLKCEVLVKPANDENCTYNLATPYFPCKKWDNFFESSKSPAELRTYLSLTDKDGTVATGDYEIWYDCFQNKRSSQTGTGWKKLHEFRVINKCSDFLPPGYESLSIAELLLHSAPSFLELKLEDCARVDAVKESIFRKYDTSPQDGRLDENEVLEALLLHDVDTSSLEYLIPESNCFRKKGGIMLNDFIESSALPLGCSGPKLTESSDVYFTEASYPTIDSDHTQCKADKEGVQLKWDYKLTPQEGDRQCLYTDGRLLRSFKTDADGNTVTSFRDERPSSGVGPDAVTLRAHMSFDSGIVENLITTSSAISQAPEEKDAYVTANDCVTKDSDGGKCFKRVSVSSALELFYNQSMSKSSIMTWLKLADVSEEDQYLWQSVEFESKYKKAFGIRESGKVFARLNDDAQVEGNITLQVEEWYHVAMLVNKGSGIEIFVNGALDDANKTVDNAQMDYPTYPSKVRILDAIALYDDFRIYTGILTRLHVSSIYSCGRQQSCALLAHATPQSRRVYCMVPKYNTQKSSKGFVPPCVVGLFYSGAAMDLQLTSIQKGVLFSFRDTALDELSYEILRRERDPISGPEGDYKAVVMIDTALDFCATTFSSLTFFDDEAIREPGRTWEYAVKTKFREVTQISDPRDYKIPFVAMLEGSVIAGKSDVPVPNVRVCTRIVVKDSASSMPLYDRNADETNLGAYMYAWRSEHQDANKRFSAFKITDQDDTSFSEVKPSDWLTISLSRFSRISQVNVCTEQEESQFDVRVLDYQDPNDKGDMGSMCILSVDDADGAPLAFKSGGSTCRSYLCRGTKVSAYFGQSVTIKSTSNAASYNVSEVQVMGVEVDCPYTSFSDDQGNFEIDILDVTGETPKRAHIGSSAFKTDIYDEIDILMLNATSQTTAEALLLAVAVDEIRFQENWETSYVLTDAEVACYLNGNVDLQQEFGHNLTKARKHYVEHGSWEGRSFTNCSATSSSSGLGLPNDNNKASLGVRPILRESRQAPLGEDLLLDGENSGDSDGNPNFLPTMNEWNAYGSVYGNPIFSESDGICILEGAIKGGDWGLLATLPEDCRPEKRITFGVNNHEESTRVDVFPNGEVKYIAGGKSNGWLSLTGIKFVTKTGQKSQLVLLHGATNYGEDYENASYSKINGECVLGGSIRKGSSWEVALLPEECRPEKALVFNVNNNECTMRLDIYEDGKIEAITGGCHDWVSLNGVSFIPWDAKVSSVALASSLENNWVPYEGGAFWEAPTYTLMNGECVVQGLVQGGSWDHIATLPEDCRPYNKLIFNLNNHQYSSRVDVSPDGRVDWVAGGQSHGWISLSGVRFPIGLMVPPHPSPPPPSPVSPSPPPWPQSPPNPSPPPPPIPAPPSPPPSPSSPSMPPRGSILPNGVNAVGKDEFISYCKNRTKFAGAHLVLQEKVWTLIDRDGSGDLNEIEFGNVMKALHNGYMYAVPWLVYPTVSTKHMTQFRAAYQDEQKMNALFSLVPVSKAALPSSQESWQKWVHALENSFPTFDMDTPHVNDISRRTLLTNMGIDGLPETKIYAVPLVTFPTTKFISLKQLVLADEKYDFAHEEHGILKEMFKYPVEIHAIQRLPDVEHLFDDGAEKISSIKHLSAAGANFEDNTAVTVTGMVRFPSNRTQDISCGLPSATIRAYEGKKCTHEELAEGKCSPKGYKYEFEPTNYTADETGEFDISITPGETWAFVASYEGHDICYGGDAVDVSPCVVHNSTSIKLSEEEFYQNVYFELENVIGGEFMTYFDVTQRQVDLGLYAGACDTPYTKYSLLITPANGCGAPIELSDAEIVGSSGSRFEKNQWPLVDPHNKSSNVRMWPYAAMDYYIQLLEAPDVENLTEDKILQEYTGASCKPPGTNIMQFFRDRDALAQTMLLLERTFAEVRYEYHGWFCVEPRFGDFPETSLRTPLTSIRSDEICIGSDAAKHDLTKEHLIGKSNMQFSKLKSQISPDKFVSLKVVEAHYIAPDTISFCSTFERSVNDVPTKLSLQVRIQQDVGPQGSNPCHSSNEPSEDCVFTKVNATTRLLQFYSEEGKDGNSYEISSKDAVPNLVPPHRRKFLARVERNDGWAVTNLAIERELVTVASKKRGGGDNPNARYQSAFEFYATAPIRGLVYTVVHDPPGGNSFASIRQGTKIDLELGLETTRGMSTDIATSTGLGLSFGNSVEIPGIEVGSAYLNADVKMNDDGVASKTMGAASFNLDSSVSLAFDGPSLSMSATTDNGWDFHFTLDRTISSSKDPALPGRPGDTILGGGFEIVYLRVDTVDIRDNCLKVVEEVQWLPRKPDTYLLSVYHVEYKLLPELQGLVATANDKDSIMTDGEMGDKSNDEVKAIWKHRLETSIDDWKRTLEWSTPDFNPEGFLKLSEAKQKEKLNEINERYDSTSIPFNSDDSVFGRLMKPKIDQVYGAYTGDDTLSDYTADRDWSDLPEVWRRVGRTRFIPAMGVPLTASSANNKPDMRNIVEGESRFTNEEKDSRWYPSKGNWLQSWEMKGNETGKNVFTSVENDAGVAKRDKLSLFSRGMSDLAENDMRERGQMSLDDIFEEDTVAKYIDASVFGSKAPFGFGGKNEKDPKLDPISTGSEQSVYLTFSGGGHALEFSSDVSSNIDSWGYSWEFETEGQKDLSVATHVALSLFYLDQGLDLMKGRLAQIEHAMAWAKYGNLKVFYSLGDLDPYDKFVVAVSSDKRFGTPIFKTIGGASKCPGEPNTVWRESGLIVETAWAAGVNNKFIPPGQNALFDIIITNESPFREGHIYGLQLISGSKFNGDFGGNMLDLSFTVNGADTLAPYQSLVPLHDIPSVDANGNLKHTRLSLNVAKGKFAQSYSSVGVQLVSQCEWELSRDILYRSPISSSAYLGDFKWERECPKVTWDETTYNTYLNTIISKNTSPFINVTLLNPDPLNLWSADYVEGDSKKTNHLVHPSVAFVRVQWRKLGEGEWINSWDMVGDDPNIWKRSVKDADAQCDSARGEGCAFKWNTERQHFLSGLKDGTWEVRAKVFCFGYDSFATSEVKQSVTEENLNVIIDVTSPEITSVSVYNRLVTIEYSELVKCPQLSAEHMSYTIERIETCEGDSVESGMVAASTVFSDYQFTCLKGERGYIIMAKWPSDAESGIYKLTVNADKLGPMVTDFAFNPSSFREQISGIAVGCNSGKKDAVVKLGSPPTLSRKKPSASASEGKGWKKVKESSLGAAAQRSSESIFFSFSELPVKFDNKFVLVTSVFAMTFVALARRRRGASKATMTLSDDNSESEKRSFLDEDENNKRRIDGKGGVTYGAVL